ncbi:MAG: ATP-dependent RNA helicase RhlB, partial [Lysobacter sp.]|nr:ATP-dependent RNA helicase RhlB [Lysobacter sp.]
AVEAATPPTGDAERAPRKRRRRRGGRRVEGAEGASVQAAVNPATPSAKPAEAKPATVVSGEAKPGLLGRIGRGLKSLVTRAPRSQH